MSSKLTLDSESVQVIDGSSIGVLIRPPSRVSAPDWCSRHRNDLRDALLERGFVVLRGLDVGQPLEFGSLAAALFGPAMPYLDASTPRTWVEGGVYTATEYPADQQIPLHNEASYAAEFPSFLAFYCERPAASGGETLLADSCAIYGTIEPELRKVFELHGVRYVRNFYEWSKPSWQTAFGTADLANVDQYCHAHGIQARWKHGSLHIEERRASTVVHPRSGDLSWFNQAHLFHASRLDSEVRQALEELYAPDEYPRHALFGNGDSIDEGTVDAIVAAYERHKLRLSLESEDILLVDNIRVAHGREPYVGSRRLYVYLAEPRSA